MHHRAILIGNPNTGKTTVFNRLCGARAKTSNFPGTTTAVRTGALKLDRSAVEILDLPGLYDLTLDIPEARIVRDVVLEARDRDDLVVVIIDAANLARNLVLVGQLAGAHARMVVCLNMMDVAERRGIILHLPALTNRLGVPIVPMVAARGEGLTDLRALVDTALSKERTIVSLSPPTVPPPNSPYSVVSAWARDVAASVVREVPDSAARGRGFTERMDRILTHPVLGFAVFMAVMGGLFWTLFALAAVPMDLIDTTFAGLSALVNSYLPEGAIRDLLTDGVIGGIAGTVVFLPQIAFLFFLISLLEDTGYLARAAFVMDRFLHRFGLPGHAFVPLLTAHACAIPGIMSTRLIPDRRDRLVTILVAPFMSCSARLPVFVMLTSILFVNQPALAPLAFAACFMLGAGAAFLSALLFSRTVFRGRARPMILELPAYQAPSIRNALLSARDQSLSFLKTAGTVIMLICVVMWWLSAYPKVDPPAEAVALRTQASTAAPADAATLVEQAEHVEARAQQAGSLAGWLGHAIQPVFAPLGYDWQLSEALLTSFLAREVFVSTMAVLGGAGDDESGVISGVRSMKREDGSPVFTIPTALSLMVFFALCCQCVSTLAVIRRETNSWRYPLIMAGYLFALAYVASFITYRVAVALGGG